MRRVLVVATGGTIASRSTADGRTASVTGAELFSQARLDATAGVRVVDLATAASFAWRPDQLRAFVRDLRRHAADAEAIVVTHGTDTMEELVFLMDLVHEGSRPIIFTGAQRPFDDPAADGPGNLADAVALARSPLADERGVLLCFDGFGYPARGVMKVDTQSAHAFAAPDRGAELRIVDGKVHALRPAAPPTRLPFDHDSGEFPRVDVVPLYVGTDTALLRAALDAGARGVVLAAFGAGNATPDMVTTVAELVGGGVPVLVCSRVPNGPVAALYGGGGGADLAAAGAVFGGDLSPWQGRMLLTVALTLPEPMSALGAWLNADTGGNDG